LPSGTSVPVQYAFDTSIGSNTVEIKAAEVDFTTSDYPQLRPKTIGRVPVTPVGSDLQWTIVEQVVGDPTLAVADPVLTASLLGDPSLSDCTAGSGQIGVPAGSPTIDATGTTVTITLQQDFSQMAAVPDVSKPESLTSCALSMKLHLTMKSSKTADVALPANTRIAYPQLAKPAFRILRSSIQPQN